MKKIFSSTVKRLPLLNKLLSITVAIVLIILMFPHKQQGTHYDYSVGSFWNDNDLYAPYDFQILKDEEEIARELALAKSKSTLYYQMDSSAYGTALSRLNGYRSQLTPDEVRRLRKTLDEVYRQGYIEVSPDYPDIEHHTIVILSGNVGSEHSFSEYLSPMDVADTLLAKHILVPSLRIDANRTQLEFDSRLSQLKYSSRAISRGELIVSKGEYITEEKGRVIASLEAENDKRFVRQFDPLAHYFGRFMLCAIAFMALFMFLNISHHEILEDTHKVIIVLVTILLMTGATAFVVHLRPEWVLIVPLCVGAILMHIIFDMQAALYIHITTIIILGHMVPDSFEFIFYQLTAGMMSIITVREFERRSQFFVACLVVFLTYSVIYTCGILWQDTNLHNLKPDRYVVFFLNAVLTLLAYPLIYLYEKVFRVTTNLTLMEIANTNTPALRELSRKAPGTFQHAMQVANISEDLINEIGGNALLAKVGGLYHDIGKICAPIYFTENQNSGFNPHSELAYAESARIITQHVRDGISLARKYHLPAEVTDFIRTHHGTTYTGYFYAKYMAEHPNEHVDASVFQYPGPMPYSRETAVVMIVDSVEAACKSLKEPTKENIDKLVDSIVQGKIDQGQMSQCPLTFHDISSIRKMLKNKMLSIYHVRISYPVTGGGNASGNSVGQ
ncbi:MAG: HDIG domain-containing protein [Bacteroidales bacterium]|nr:HDIG domain-containing protein [Bacteroidales bacterium]